MACNCTTQEDLNRLYAKYGYKLDVSKTKTFSHNVKAISQYCLAVIICILFSPFFLLYMIYKANDDDNRIDVTKILRLNNNTNVRKQ